MNQTPICSLAKQNQIHSETPVENLFIMEYMLKAPGDFVKVYLYALMQAHYPDLSESSVTHFARALGMDEAKVLDAFAYWQRQGIARYHEDGETVFEIERIYDTLLEGKSVKEIKLYGRAEFNTKIQGIFGKRYFSDFAKVYDWLDVYALSEDVVIYLLERFVDDKGRIMNEKGRAVDESGKAIRFSYLDAVALDWANKGIKTVAEAENYLLGRAIESSDARKVLRHIGLDRPPTVDEYWLYNKWTGWGFTLKTVLLAAGQMTRIQKPNFAYVDKVLENLKNKGAIEFAAVKAALSEKPPSADNRQNGHGKQAGAPKPKNAGDSLMRREYEQYAPETRVLRDDDPDDL